MKVYFSLLFEKRGADREALTEVTYFCVCNACKRVYAYKASDGSGFRDEDARLYVALPPSVLQELQAQTSTIVLCVACCRPSKICIGSILKHVRAYWTVT